VKGNEVNTRMLRAYLDAALRRATYETLPEDEGIYGEISGFDGLWANAPTLDECKRELESALEDWIVVGLRLGHELPEVEGLRLPIPEIA
jgi:predicted RNase H-like HicB family nuclease